MEKTSLLYVFVVGQTYIFILTGSFSFVIRLKSFSVPQAKLVVVFDYSIQKSTPQAVEQLQNIQTAQIRAPV
jgi:hypothetical protein